MHLPTRGKIEWNLNTVVMTIGFAGGLVAWGVTWGSFTSEVRALDQRTAVWATNHDNYHKDRLAEVKIRDGRIDADIATLKDDIKQIDNIAYRVTVVEQGQQATTKSIDELKIAISQQATDIRIVREILEQLREAQGLPRRQGN